MNTRSVDAVGISMIAAVVAGMYLGGVRPLQTAYSDTVSLKADLWLSQRTLAEREESEKHASEAAGQLTDRLENLDIELSNIDQINARLSRLTAIAELAGMTLEGLRPGAEAKAERYRAIEISLVGRVNYIQAVEFLAALRKELPDTGLLGIRFERIAAQDGVSGRLQLEMVWYAAPNASDGHEG
ncbi:MAG: hypothetical protein ED559_05960 [Phycisphaera sp.]|nr:MAG: hypothetical protein ED559_05960 [Phycisphaera sp.]